MSKKEDSILEINEERDADGISKNFIEQLIDKDLAEGVYHTVHTRFPPEPNGYLHIGHAKSILLNYGLAQKYDGKFNMRFDDTNPTKEKIEFVESIKKDIRWLGADWEDRLYFASDYFEQMYEYAVELIKRGKAYVCSLTADEIREYRGTLTEPGKESPYRNRPVEESLDLFKRMRAGEFEDGTYLLRAKIDMASPNINMRDPAIYRIRKAEHHRTGNKWCIYPMYDFAHCLSDSIEGITHSICTLEFEIHRPLYDWYLDQLPVPCHPQQIEFAKLCLTRIILSKRNLLKLVKEGIVSGWDDPRMPTLAGMRRRGYTPSSIRKLCETVGVAKANSTVDIALLEHCLREDLNKKALRVMAVLHPLKVVIDNYPDDLVEELDAENNPEDPSMGTRKIPFSKVIYIEQEDFREDPPKNYFRLSPGREIRLKHAYYIKCESVVKDEKTGEVIEVHCSYDPKSRGGWTDDGRKVKGTSHWVSAHHAIPAEVRLYDYLFKDESGEEDDEEKEEKTDFLSRVNKDSLEVIKKAMVEPGLKDAKAGESYQFLRQGYFCVDSVDSRPDAPVFNRTVSLKDTWAKLEKKTRG